MAVFTPLTDPELDSCLRDYAIGEKLEFRGISSGVENSNFFLNTTEGEYVLTIFEKLRETELPFYLNFMQHLAAHDIPVPDPVRRLDGQLFGLFQGKPLAIVTKLQGHAEMAPAAHHCALVGAMLARCHLVGQDLPAQQPNLRSLPWWQEMAPALRAHLTPSEVSLLETELAYQTAFFGSADHARLPGGPCHCDLFRDNVLIVSGEQEGQDQLGGFFDFYFAGADKWLFDLAVTVNDWCVDLDSGELDPLRTHAMLSAYEAVRPLQPAEKRHWRDMLRAGAMRFWISRLVDFHMPRAAHMLLPHDPSRFERTLRARIRATSLSVDRTLP